MDGTPFRAQHFLVSAAKSAAVALVSQALSGMGCQIHGLETGASRHLRRAQSITDPKRAPRLRWSRRRSEFMSWLKFRNRLPARQAFYPSFSVHHLNAAQ